MASPKSAKIVACDAPDEPEDALAAGTDDAGQMAEIEASRAEQAAASVGSVAVGAQRTGSGPGGGEQQQQQPEKTWVAFRLLGVDGDAIEGESLKLVVDGEEESASTDGSGEVKKEEIDRGTPVKVHLTDRYDFEWEKVDVEESGPSGPATGSQTSTEGQTGTQSAGGAQEQQGGTTSGGSGSTGSSSQGSQGGQTSRGGSQGGQTSRGGSSGGAGEGREQQSQQQSGTGTTSSGGESGGSTSQSSQGGN